MTTDLPLTTLLNASLATPTPGLPDNTALIAGAVGGSIGFLLLLALIVFLVVRSRRNTKQPSPAANPAQKQYDQIPSAEYNVGAFDKPGGDYGVLPNQKNDRYSDPAILSSPANDGYVEMRVSGIRVQHTGVGTNYAEGL